VSKKFATFVANVDLAGQGRQAGKQTRNKKNKNHVSRK
jgi:hypothetical protein